MQRRRLVAGAAAIAGWPFIARAEDFPARSLRWVIPFAPAGNYDVTARIVSDPMSRDLGQSIVIDNRPGAGGVVGLEAMLSAPSDGYTIVMASFSVSYVAPILAGKSPILPQLVPVSILTTVPTLLVARSDGRFADMAAMLKEAKIKPGTVTMGHPGNGTTNHVAILRLQLNEKVDFNTIPYKGAGPGINDLLAGSIDCFVDQLTSSMPHIRSGKLRPLAVFGLERAADLPTVPTLKDLGCTSFEAGTTAGVFVRAGTAAPMIARLNRAVVAGLNDGNAGKRLRELGATVRPSTPEQFADALKADEANVGELLKKGLLKAT